VDAASREKSSEPDLNIAAESWALRLKTAPDKLVPAK
jgi:hypothetical protein